MKDLFILDEGANRNLRSQLEERLHIVQEVSPRMLIVEGRSQDLEAARHLPGALVKEDLSQSDLALTASEKLFADAWSKPSDADETERPFEGYNWGAKGFSPP